MASWTFSSGRVSRFCAFWTSWCQDMDYPAIPQWMAWVFLAVATFSLGHGQARQSPCEGFTAISKMIWDFFDGRKTAHLLGQINSCDHSLLRLRWFLLPECTVLNILLLNQQSYPSRAAFQPLQMCKTLTCLWKLDGHCSTWKNFLNITKGFWLL